MTGSRVTSGGIIDSAEPIEELAAANDQLNAAEAYHRPLNRELTKLINPANYPDPQTDAR